MSVLFLIVACLVPALILTICNLAAAYLVAVKRGYPTRGEFTGWYEVARAFAAALPGLLVIAIIGCGSTLQTVWSTRPGAGGKLAWTGLVTAGSMLLCVGDGFAPILIGLGILSLGAWGLSRGGDPASNVAALAGNVSVLLGFIFLFWSLGGAFGPEGYDPDGAPRFVLVTTGAASAQGDKATLTMSTHAGALITRRRP